MNNLKNFIFCVFVFSQLDGLFLTAKNYEDFDLQKRLDEHWSWQKLDKAPIPQINNVEWSKNPIDAFIYKKINESGLKPAQEADKRTWLRRVYFDLIGLSPTPHDYQKFINDESGNAHERVVNQLLNSGHFGEKWARHWLDLVRFSETSGHENNYDIPAAHQYRDYVIRALNEDVPYNQFITEHIAGDLIKNPRVHPIEGFNESIIGTGFWYFHSSAPFPPDSLSNEAEIIDDQIDVFGKTFLALTVACARCHDHKTDAVSMEDYYALSSYLQSSTQQTALLDPANKIRFHRSQVDNLLDDAFHELTHLESIPDNKLDVESYMAVAQDLYSRLKLDEAINEIPQEWIDNTAISNGLDAGKLKTWIRVAGSLSSFSNVRFDTSNTKIFQDFSSHKIPDDWSQSGTSFEVISKPSIAVDGSILKPGIISNRRLGRDQIGTLRSPTFTIEHPYIHLRVRASSNIRMQMVINSYRLAHHRDLLFEGTVIQGEKSDTKGEWVWKSFGRSLQNYIGHRAHFEIIDSDEGYVEIDEIRFSNQPAPKKILSHESLTFNDLWKASLENLRKGQIDEFFSYLMQHQLIDIRDLSDALDFLLSSAQDFLLDAPNPKPVLAMAQMTPESARIYNRGNPHKPGRPVNARTLEAFRSIEGDRLALAQSMTMPDNPLVSRVIVNRIWHYLFGNGIVKSVDDFGPMGEVPTHPELLDWLAVELMENDWSLKNVIRSIVLSKTYRQSSRPRYYGNSQGYKELDPTNQLLSFMPVRRLPAESLRDHILSVSGSLDSRLYGNSIMVYVTPFMLDCEQPKESGPLNGLGRRTVYQKVDRNFLNPMMLVFDTPSPFGTQGCRSKSNVPAQALSLLNDPFVIEESRKWAEQVLIIEDWTHSQRIKYMVEHAHGSTPTETEIQTLLTFLDRQAREYGISKADIRCWSDLAHCLINMKSFSYLR